MVDIYSDAYWTKEFTINEADVDRLAAFIDNSSQAQPLSTLAKRVVNGRLLYGQEQSAPVGQIFGGDTSVKRWDPAAEWRVGDHAIVLLTSGKRFVAIIGEIQGVAINEQGPEFSQVEVFIAEQNRVQKYGLLPANDPQRQTIMANVRYEIARKREYLASQDSDKTDLETVEIIMYEYGEQILGPLLQALGQDERFVRLDGRYFLRSHTLPPSETQLHQLAWSLLGATEALYTSDLINHIPDFDLRDETLFGLYLSLRQHQQWFSNTQPGKRPSWVLAGPPPGSFTPQKAAFDPDSYEILCLPETEPSPAAVARLWETELLTAVV